MLGNNCSVLMRISQKDDVDLAQAPQQSSPTRNLNKQNV